MMFKKWRKHEFKDPINFYGAIILAAIVVIMYAMTITNVIKYMHK